MKKIIVTVLFIVFLDNVIAQNTSPLPSGNTTVGNHLSIGNGNEVWSNATNMYFNYRGNAQQTHFWNLGGSSGRSIMSLYNNGQVLFSGTAVVKRDLHVGGDNGVNSKLYVSSSKSGISEGVRLHDIGSGSNEGLWIQFSQANMNDMARIGAKSEDISRGSLKFYTKDTGDTGSVERMAIAPNGNITIGTLSSSDETGIYKLSVNGKVRANEVKVYTGWADFVFEKDYNLPTLKEVENHINNKGHLKDIPSAKEVKENGVYLGEMNSKLLQKIEELTLYTIQQEKRINSLENRNDKLEEENEELKSISERLSQLEKLIKE